jgi:hypothetical protein
VLGRAGTSDDCANIITFLCSEANSLISGVEIAVDGGGLDVG